MLPFMSQLRTVTNEGKLPYDPILLEKLTWNYVHQWMVHKTRNTHNINRVFTFSHSLWCLIIINLNAKHDGPAKQEFSETCGWHVHLIGDNRQPLTLTVEKGQKKGVREEHEASQLLGNFQLFLDWLTWTSTRDINSNELLQRSAHSCDE